MEVPVGLDGRVVTGPEWSPQVREVLDMLRDYAETSSTVALGTLLRIVPELDLEMLFLDQLTSWLNNHEFWGKVDERVEAKQELRAVLLSFAAATAAASPFAERFMAAVNG